MKDNIEGLFILKEYLKNLSDNFEDKDKFKKEHFFGDVSNVPLSWVHGSDDNYIYDPKYEYVPPVIRYDNEGLDYYDDTLNEDNRPHFIRNENTNVNSSDIAEDIVLNNRIVQDLNDAQISGNNNSQ